MGRIPPFFKFLKFSNFFLIFVVFVCCLLFLFVFVCFCLFVFVLSGLWCIYGLKLVHLVLPLLVRWPKPTPGLCEKALASAQRAKGHRQQAKVQFVFILIWTKIRTTFSLSFQLLPLVMRWVRPRQSSFLILIIRITTTYVAFVLILFQIRIQTKWKANVSFSLRPEMQKRPEKHQRPEMQSLCNRGQRCKRALNNYFSKNKNNREPATGKRDQATGNRDQIITVKLKKKKRK